MSNAREGERETEGSERGRRNFLPVFTAKTLLKKTVVSNWVLPRARVLQSQSKQFQQHLGGGREGGSERDVVISSERENVCAWVRLETAALGKHTPTHVGLLWSGAVPAKIIITAGCGIWDLEP